MNTSPSNSLTATDLQWHEQAFQTLSPEVLYAILRLRQAVFTVEQHCAYQDADNLDQQARHVCALAPSETTTELAAYARITAPGTRFPEVSIGRVIVAPQWRGQQLGQVLMSHTLSACQQHYPNLAIRISAQQPLEAFYQALGFTTVSEPYAEDGIPHVEMLRSPEPTVP